jgi:hypothetical protein
MNRNTAIVSSISLSGLILFIYSQFYRLPVFPDEVAYKNVTGRWRETGFMGPSFDWLCRVKGYSVPHYFWPSRLIAGLWAELINTYPWLERAAPAITLILLYGFLLYWQARKSQSILKLGPLLVCSSLGIIPGWLLLQRPEFVWTTTALIMLCVLNLKNTLFKRVVWIAAFLAFYYGSYLHQEFWALYPAVVASGMHAYRSRLARSVILLLATSVILSSFHFLSIRDGCPDAEILQATFDEESLPKPAAISALISALTINLSGIGPFELADGGFPALNSSPIQGSTAIIHSIVILGCFAWIVLAWARTSLLEISSILRYLRNFNTPAYQATYEFNNMAVNLILASALFIIIFDPNLLGYRTAAGFCVGVFAAASADITNSFHLLPWGVKRLLIYFILALIILSMASSVYYAVFHFASAFQSGYTGPSTSRAIWEKNLTTKTPSHLLANQALAELTGGKREILIIDNYTYPWFHDEFLNLVEITYLGRAVDYGLSPAEINSRLRGVPFAVRCGNSYVRSLGLKGKTTTEGLRAKIPIEHGESICIGIVE